MEQKQSDQQPFAQGQPSSTLTCNDDDVQEIGTINAVRLPHARHDCPHHTFVQDVLHKNLSKDGLEANQTTCDMCYCFVCDCLASECKDWTCGDDLAQCISAASCHCLASNQGVDSKFWVGMRERQKGRTSNMSNEDALNSHVGRNANGSTASFTTTPADAQNEEVDHANSLAPSHADAVILSHNLTLNAPALAPVASANEQLRRCSRCYISKPRSGYNRKQWTMRKNNRRCCADCSQKRQHNRNIPEQCGRRCKNCRVRKEQSQYVKAQWRRFTRTGKFDGICRQCKNTREFQHPVLPATRPQQPVRLLSEVQAIPIEILVPNPTPASLQATTSNYATRRDQGRCVCPKCKDDFDRTTPTPGLLGGNSHAQEELNRKRSRDEYYHYGTDYDDNSSRPNQRRITLSPENVEHFGRSSQISRMGDPVPLIRGWGVDDQHPSSTVPTQLPLQQPLRPAMPNSQASWEPSATAHVPRQAPLRMLSQSRVPPPASIFYR